MAKKDEETGMDRRGFLECMAWVGTGAVWTMSSGVLKGMPLGQTGEHADGARGRQRRPPVRADQRQPHRLRQAREHRRHRDAARRDREDQGRCPSRRPSSCTPATSRTCRSRPSSTRCSRCCRSSRCRCSTCPANTTCSRTTARATCERFGKGTQGAGWHSFDQNGVHFIGLVNVVNLKAGGLGSLGKRTARVAREGRQASREQHAHRRLRAHSAVVGLPRMGLGHRRQRAGAVVPEALRLGLGAERPHSPGDAEGRRAHHLPHGDVDRLPAAGAGHGAVAGTDEGGGGPVEEGTGPDAGVVPRRSIIRSPSPTCRSRDRRWPPPPITWRASRSSSADACLEDSEPSTRSRT